MKVVFLESARNDIEWFRTYYRTAFPSGESNAKARYRRAKEALKSHPQIGHSADQADLREFVITGTPFAFIYRIRGQDIQIVRLWDNRADRPPSWA